MLAAIGDYFAWYQLPLLLIFVFFALPAWVFGVGALLFVGGRYIAKSPKATYWWSVLTNVVASIGGTLAHIIVAGIGLAFLSKADSPFPTMMVSFGGLIIGVLVTWTIIQAMFKVSFGKAILAWLPTFGVKFLLVIPLLVSILLPSVNRARELAKQAVCKTHLKQIGVALEVYYMREDEYPQTLKNLYSVDEVADYVAELNLRCPSDATKRDISYFYYPTSTSHPFFSQQSILVCDFKDNHKGVRNVLYRDGVIKVLTEEDFQAELSKWTNEVFAVELRKAEGP